MEGQDDPEASGGGGGFPDGVEAENLEQIVAP